MPRQRQEMTTVQIPTKDLKRFDAPAKRLGVSRATIIRWACNAYDLSLLPSGSVSSTVAKTKRGEVAEVPA